MILSVLAVLLVLPQIYGPPLGGPTHSLPFTHTWESHPPNLQGSREESTTGKSKAQASQATRDCADGFHPPFPICAYPRAGTHLLWAPLAHPGRTKVVLPGAGWWSGQQSYFFIIALLHTSATPCLLHAHSLSSPGKSVTIPSSGWLPLR